MVGLPFSAASVSGVSPKDKLKDAVPYNVWKLDQDIVEFPHVL